MALLGRLLVLLGLLVLSGLLRGPLLSARLLGPALTRWGFLRRRTACGGLGRLLAFRDEPTRSGVSRLALSLLPLHLAELRGVVSILWTRVGTPTASLGLLSMLVFRRLVI